MRPLAVLRSLAILLLAGSLAGGLAGLGARLAMRLAAILSPASRQGLATAEGGVVGAITWEGTLAVVAIGVFVGLAGALLYAALRAFLPQRRRGLAFGLVALLLVGWTILEPLNADFRAFGSEGLNYALFAALFLLYGVALVRLEGALDNAATRRGWAALVWTPIVALGGGVAFLGLVFAADRRPMFGVVALAVVLSAHALRAGLRYHEKRDAGSGA